MLFKYFKITDYLKTNLRERQIWFSAPCDFNDVDDSDLRIDWQLTDEDIWNEFGFLQQVIYQSAMMNKDYSCKPADLESQVRMDFMSMLADRGPDGTPDHSGKLRAPVTEALDLRRRTIGISCFAQSNLNRLMWSHYADGDRGICIGIDTKFDSECFLQLEVVNYVEALPKIKLLSHMRTNLITLYTTKTSEWSYEQEVRAFQHTKGNHPMDARCLVSVFVGERISRNDLEEIRDIVRHKYGKEVDLLQMIRTESGRRNFESLAD